MTFQSFKVNHPLGENTTQIILEFESNMIQNSKDSTIPWELWRENEKIFSLPLETFKLSNGEEVQIFYIKIVENRLLADIGLLEASDQYKITFFKKQSIGQFQASNGNTFSHTSTKHNLQFALNEEFNEPVKTFDGFLLRAKKDISRTRFSLDFYLSSKQILSLDDVQVLEIQQKANRFILNDWNIRPNRYVSYELRQEGKSLSSGTWVSGENQFLAILERMVPSSHQKIDPLNGFIQIFSQLLSANYTQAKAMRNYFDLDQAPSYLLPALAYGLGLKSPPPWPLAWNAHKVEQVTRTLLKQAIPLCQEKGTKKGLERLLRLLEINDAEIYEDRDFLFFSYSKSLGYTYCKANKQFRSLKILPNANKQFHSLKILLPNGLKIWVDFSKWDKTKLEEFLKTSLPFTRHLELIDNKSIRLPSAVLKHPIKLSPETEKNMLLADLTQDQEERASTYVINNAKEKNYMAVKLNQDSPILHTTWNERDDIRRYQFQGMVKCVLDSLESNKLNKTKFAPDWNMDWSVDGDKISLKNTILIEVEGILVLLKSGKEISVSPNQNQIFYIYLDPELKPLTKISGVLEKDSLLLKMSKVGCETAEALIVGEKLNCSSSSIKKYKLFSIQYNNNRWEPETFFYRKLKMPELTEGEILQQNIQAIRLRPGVPITHEVWNATDEVRRVQTKTFFKSLFGSNGFIYKADNQVKLKLESSKIFLESKEEIQFIFDGELIYIKDLNEITDLTTYINNPENGFVSETETEFPIYLEITEVEVPPQDFEITEVEVPQQDSTRITKVCKLVLFAKEPNPKKNYFLLAYLSCTSAEKSLNETGLKRTKNAREKAEKELIIQTISISTSSEGK
jgi:phage tail-like protein